MTGLPPRRWAPDVHRALTGLLPDPGVATLDWDNTCIRGDIGEAVLRALGPEPWALYEALEASQGRAVAYAYCATALAGVTADGLRAHTRQVWDECLADGTITVRPEMVDLVAALQSHGWEVWVVTASAEIVVATVAGFYGIAPERVLGVRLVDDGVLQPRIDGPLTYRQGKVEVIERHIGKRARLAAGDHETDIDMLQAAEHGLVIDRGSEELRAVAAAHGWWVQPGW